MTFDSDYDFLYDLSLHIMTSLFHFFHIGAFISIDCPKAFNYSLPSKPYSRVWDKGFCDCASL